MRLNGTDILWALTGSLGFALHGMNMPVNDIDLQTDKDGAYRITQQFPDNIVRPVTCSSSETIRSHFGELCINEATVEIMGALQKRLSTDQWEEPVDIRPLREYVSYRGLTIPVLSLSYEYTAYCQLGRTEKAAAIRAHRAKSGRNQAK